MSDIEDFILEATDPSNSRRPSTSSRRPSSVSSRRLSSSERRNSERRPSVSGISRSRQPSVSRSISNRRPSVHVRAPTPETGNLDDTAGLVENAEPMAAIEATSEDDIVYSPAPPTTASGGRSQRQVARVLISPDPSDLPLGPTDEVYKDFKALPTTLPAALSIFASFCMICAVFVVPGVCGTDNTDTVSYGPDESTGELVKCPVQPFSLLIYCHAAYWLLHLIIDPYLKSKHKANRLQGYLLFYLDTKNIRRAPFYVVSIGNFALLVADVVLNDFCHAYASSCTHGRFSRVDWLRGLITVEAMAVLCLFSFYIRKVQTFNRGRFKPDVMRPEIMHGLGVSLVLKFPRPDEETTEEEETHRAGLNMARDELRRLEMLSEMTHVFGNDWKEEDTQVRMMQAELIAFLIRQIKRKNRKVVTLTHHLARYTDDVVGMVAQGIEYP